MLRFSYRRHTLHFRQEARTSRGSMKEHICYIIQAEDPKVPFRKAHGEASPLPGLSIDARPDFEISLQQFVSLLNEGVPYELLPGLEKFPSIRFALETALAEFSHDDAKKIFESSFYEGTPIPINGLVWMDDVQSMFDAAVQKAEQGFSCI